MTLDQPARYATNRSLALPRPVAFVFSGGASSGALHVGMLRAVEAHGIRPDLLVGTSVGALHGAVVAGEVRGAGTRLERIWRRLERNDIFPTPGIRQISSLLRNGRHLVNPGALADLIREHKPGDRLEDLAAPLAVVVTDAATGRARALTAGRIEPALMASTAIPGVFPRVRIGGRWYVDGGVAANLPVRQAMELGAASLVLFDATAARDGREPPSNIAQTFVQLAGMVLRRQLERDLRELSPGTPVVHLRAERPLDVSPFDFGRTGDLIALGYRSALNTLAVARTDAAADAGALPLVVM